MNIMRNLLFTFLICLGAILNSLAVDPPRFTFTPDTINKQGIVQIDMIIDEPENFLDGYVYYRDPPVFVTLKKQAKKPL